MSQQAPEKSNTAKNAVLKTAAAAGVAYYFIKSFNENREIADAIVDAGENVQLLPKLLVKQASSIVAEAFDKNKPFRAIFRREGEELVKCTQWIFERHFDLLVAEKTAYCSISKSKEKYVIKSFAVLIPMSRKFTAFDYIKSGFVKFPVVFGFETYNRMQHVADWIEKREEKIMKGKECYLLQRMTTNKEWQRRGLGQKFLEALLDQRQKKLPILLETQDQSSMEFYCKAGFRLILEDDYVPEDGNAQYGFHSWFMVYED